MKRKLLLWVLTAVLTLSVFVYLRVTGPTYPVRGNVEIGGNIVKFKLLRSHETTADAELRITVPDTQVTGETRLRRYKSDDQWSTVPLRREGDVLVSDIPKQPAAGKVMYVVTLTGAAGSRHSLTDEPVIMRFRDPVPPIILIPHVLFMVVAMLLSTRTGLEALTRGTKTRTLTFWTSLFIIAGGMVLGPIVQKFAFGAFWTGWPLGHDLTDNKTAVAVLFWIIALWRTRRQGRGRSWVIAAAIVTLAVYLIPHSMLGSEIDYTQSGT